VAAADLGLTLIHEHVFIDLMREYRGNGLLHDEALAVAELGRFHEAGGRTLVDVTSEGLGRDPRGLLRVSEATGLHVVMGAGLYRRPYLDVERVDRASVDHLAGGIARDVLEGVDGTGIRAGIIGEIGCDRYLSAAEERVFRAAARAQRGTGVTITTHAARWPVGLWQLDVLEEEGVDPGRVIVGHSDTVPDPAYHRAIAERGAYVEFDTVQGESEWDTRQRIDFIRALLDAGFEDRLLLSHDVCLRTDLSISGGPGYAYLLTGFRERLREAGLPADLFDRLMIDNPRRALTGEA
jgi:phosphotriesterase-related protein